MNYQKLTLATFSENLAGGRYQNVTGARRAIGKADWSQADKDKAQALANKHFGENEAPAKPAKQKAAAKKPAVKAAAVKAAKPAKVEKAPRGRRSRTEGTTGSPVPTLPPSEFRHMEAIHTSTQIIAASAAAIRALAEAKQLDPSLDTSETQDAINVIAKAVRSMGANISESPLKGFSRNHATANGTAGHADEEEEGLFPQGANPV